MSKKQILSAVVFLGFAGLLLAMAARLNHTDPLAWTTDPEKDAYFLNYDMEIYMPISGGAEGGNLDAKDALRICPTLIRTLRFGDSTQWDACYAPIDTLMEQYDAYGYLPREAYEGVGDYVTSMDAPLLGVTAELAYERSGDQRFRQYVVDLIPYLTQDTTQNGYVLKISDTEWWPLEYAWTTVTDADAWYVYNGSLFGMVCIEMLANLTEDASLLQLGKNAFNAYQSKAADFLYPDGSWCWYALNSVKGTPIIDRQEKVFIELSALRALHQLTGASFYQEEAETREALLKSNLPVYVVQDAQGAQAYLLRACAPHPYLVDIYPTTIEFLAADGTVVATANSPTYTVEYCTLLAEVPDTVTAYRLYAATNPMQNLLLFEAPVRFVSRTELDARMADAVTAGSWSIFGDSVSLDGNMLTLSPAASDQLKAGLIYKFEEPVNYEMETYFAVELTNHTQTTLPVTMALLDEEQGTSIGRTGVSCLPGKNLQLYHYTGFMGIDASTKAASSWQLQLITNAMEEPSGTVELGNVYVFQSTAEVVEYLRNHAYSDYWIEK